MCVAFRRLEEIVVNIVLNGWNAFHVLLQISDNIIKILAVVSMGAIEVVVDKLEDLLSNFFVGRVVFHSVAYMVIISYFSAKVHNFFHKSEKCCLTYTWYRDKKCPKQHF